MHNSRRPIDRLSALCYPVTLTFDLLTILISGIVMDYACARFGDRGLYGSTSCISLLDTAVLV